MELGDEDGLGLCWALLAVVELSAMGRTFAQFMELGHEGSPWSLLNHAFLIYVVGLRSQYNIECRDGNTYECGCPVLEASDQVLIIPKDIVLAIPTPTTLNKRQICPKLNVDFISRSPLRTNSGRHLLNHIGGRLLRDHPIIPFDCRLRQIVIIQLNKPTPTTKPMSAQCSPASLNTVCSERCTQTLQARGHAMHVRKATIVTGLNLLPRIAVYILHGQRGIMEGKRCGQEREDADLHGWIVKYWEFDTVRRTVAVWELAADRGISDCNCDGAREHESGVLDDFRAHVGQCTVDDN